VLTVSILLYLGEGHDRKTPYMRFDHRERPVEWNKRKDGSVWQNAKTSKKRLIEALFALLTIYFLGDIIKGRVKSEP
jgi:hypothetical protein